LKRLIFHDVFTLESLALGTPLYILDAILYPCEAFFINVMTPAPKSQPESLSDVFFSFSRLATQGFGGVLAYMERELVERKGWLTREEFVGEWAVARTMPGPAALNLSIMVGARYFGLRGSLAAVGGMFMFPTMLIILLAIGYARFGEQPQVVGALQGMGAVAAALFIATGLKLLTALKSNPLGLVLCVLLLIMTFVGVALFHWSVIHAMLGLGGLGCVIAYLKIKARR
jgi:chromate transporter